MQMTVNEADWKLFRKKLPDWQEAYMERLNREYASLLAGSGAASDKFWELDRRIREDKPRINMSTRMSRDNMNHNITMLLVNGVISLSDLNDFSDDMKKQMGKMVSTDNREE